MDAEGYEREKAAALAYHKRKEELEI